MAAAEEVRARAPSVPGRSARWVVPLALALTMGGLIAVAASGAQRGAANAIVSPDQYSSPAPPPTSPFSNPFVVAGVALGILIIVLAVLLAIRLQNRTMGRGGSEETPPEEEGSSTEPGDDVELAEEGGSEETLEPGDGDG